MYLVESSAFALCVFEETIANVFVKATVAKSDAYESCYADRVTLRVFIKVGKVSSETSNARVPSVEPVCVCVCV